MSKNPGLLRGFTGLDVRRDPADSDPRSLRRATNVSLSTAGSLVRRDALIEVCALHAQSVGLYSANGSLRAVVPGGSADYMSLRPANVMYDPVGINNANFPDNLIDQILGVEQIGGTASDGAYPYVSLLMTDGTVQHHWLNAKPATTATAVSTKVSLPFDPGMTLTKIVDKIWTDDPTNGVVRFSSTVNGPTDWVAVRDAGQLAVRQHAAADGTVKALSFFQDRLLVAFGDAIQLWNVDQDPALNSLFRAYTGPGTDVPGSIENVRGDSFYFSRGGFRSMAVATQTGEPREGDIGAPIQPLTDDILSTTAVALWSQARSQYICAFGTEVWVYTNSVISKVAGWTRWVLPVPVEYLVEHNGQMYVRSGDTLYVFDPLVVLDASAAGVNYDVQTQYLDAGTPGQTKRWRAMDVVQSGTSHLKFYSQPRDFAAVSDGPNLTGTSYDQGIIPVGEWSENLAVGFTGTSIWQLDALLLHYDVLKGGM